MRWTLLSCVWALLVWWFGRAPELAADFMGWRQADTQTIALLQAEPGGSILRPQIAWGGDGPGYVEAEFPLFAFLTSIGLVLFGNVEWPGQALSMLCMVGAGVVLFATTLKRFGDAAAWVAGAVFLSSFPAVFLSVSVQPDSLSFLCGVISVAAFRGFVDEGTRSSLAVATVALGLAALCKITALHLGASQFLWLWLQRRQRLRTPAVWGAWASVLVVVGVYSWHAYQLYEGYGNSFGVIGGDSKFPTWQSITSLGIYAKTLKVTSLWGPGLLGLAALVGLMALRSLTALDIALWSGFGLLLLVAQRYTSHALWGVHYHVFGLIPGLVSIGRVVRVLEERTARLGRFVVLGSLIVAVAQFTFALHRKHERRNEGAAYVALGKRSKKWLCPTSRIVVRSSQPSRNGAFWGGGPLNYQNPILFYVTDTEGWVLPKDSTGGKPLADLRRRGADVYFEPGPETNDADLTEWLSQNARLLLSEPAGRVYRLLPTQSVDVER